MMNAEAPGSYPVPSAPAPAHSGPVLYATIPPRYFAEGCSAMILNVPIGTEDMAHVIRSIHRGAELAAAA